MAIEGYRAYALYPHVVGNRLGHQYDMKEYFKDYTFDEWTRLSEEKQRDIINNYWDPFNPTIGQKTKTTIIENFLKTLDDKSTRQVGIRNFGFYAVLLFVITDNSKQKIKNKFAGLLINKGTMSKKIKHNIYKVKWRHSGHEDIDLTEKIIIR
jgi:hypothetical protein